MEGVQVSVVHSAQISDCLSGNIRFGDSEVSRLCRLK